MMRDDSTVDFDDHTNWLWALEIAELADLYFDVQRENAAPIDEWIDIGGES